MKEDVQIKSLLKIISEGIYEKQHILAMSLLSAIAGESIFLIGPPGTAKSLVARRLKMVFKGGSAFEYLMSRFSTPDEIFGPVSISLLKNEDRYERVVDGFLPTASVVFLDEIWKAGPSIQNALLTAINERIYQNGSTTLTLPMKVLIAASNELPAEDEGLEALWDRLLVRMVSNCIQNEATFFKMIRQKPVNQITVPSDLQITDKVYREWQRKIDDIVISDVVCRMVSDIRKSLSAESKKDDVNAMDFYISDRRWKKCFRLMQASAFLNGRDAIDETDVPILLYCLWNKKETIPTIIDIVGRSLTSDIDSKAERLTKDIEQALKSTPNGHLKETNQKFVEEDYKTVSFFYFLVKDHPKGKCLFFKPDYTHVSARKISDGILYWDDSKNAWVIHAIYTGTPFDYKMKSGSNSSMVKLNKCNGGIMIDGTAYVFERKNYTKGPDLFEGDVALSVNVADLALEELNNDLRPRYERLQELFSKTKHLFLSENDMKIVKKNLSASERRLKELEVKATNAKPLL